MLEESAWSPKTRGLIRIFADLLLGIPVEMDTGSELLSIYFTYFHFATSYGIIMWE
jgi:hypothetical protein